jgi:ubiquinone biosynthesis protein Coq4
MYADSLTIAEARAVFFARSGFTEGHYTRRLAKAQVGPVPFYFFNFKARRESLPIHDIHHILTGYETNLPGECQISAWELASGVRKLDLEASFYVLNVATGLFLCPRKMWAAYRRGRRCRNFYGRELGALLEKTVGELRSEAGLA